MGLVPVYLRTVRSGNSGSSTLLLDNPTLQRQSQADISRRSSHNLLFECRSPTAYAMMKYEARTVVRLPLTEHHQNNGLLLFCVVPRDSKVT
jgi:hypothetical protein